MKWTAGKIAYIVGIFGSMLLGALTYAGVMQMSDMLMMVLVIAGLVIGFMNIEAAETTGFLLAAIAIAVLTAGFSVLPFVGGFVESVIQTVAVVTAPAALVVAIKAAMKYAS